MIPAQQRWTLDSGPPPQIWPESMSHKRKEISTFGKPYKFAGWTQNPERRLIPKFIPKPKDELEGELKTMGLAPVYDEDGTTMVATTTYKRPEFEMPTDKELVEALEDRFSEPRLVPDPEVCKVAELPKIMGQKLYAGPATSVKVWGDDFNRSFGEFEIRIRQSRVLMDKMIAFGPLKTSLSDLMNKGYWLETLIGHRDVHPQSNRRIRVYLTDGTDRYKLYSLSFLELQENGKANGQYDLGAMVPDNSNLLRTHSSARYPKPVIQYVPVVKDRDPFEVLAEKYPPIKKKKLTMDTVVGNRTLGERLSDWTG